MTAMLSVSLHSLIISALLMGQSLVGTWEERVTENRKSYDVEIIDRISFCIDGTCTETGVCDVNYKQGRCVIRYSVNGTYELTDDILYFNFIPSSIKIEYEQDNIPGLIEKMVLKPLVESYRKSLAKTASFRLDNISDTEIVLKSTKSSSEERYIKIKN